MGQFDEEWSPRGIVANVLDCNIVISEFELQPHLFYHFQTIALGKYMNAVVYKYRQNIIKHNDDFKERTNTLIYKNIPLTLYSRKG